MQTAQRVRRVIFILAGCSACSSPVAQTPTDAGRVADATVETTDAGEPVKQDAGMDAATPADAGTEDATIADAGTSTMAPDAGLPDPLSLRVVTFNTGTGANPPFNQMGYTDAEAAISDEWYGNGLAWVEAINDARTFFDTIDADVVVFQEIFHSEDCVDIPAAAHAGFVCETWMAGDPTVTQLVLGPGWQIACHLDKNDKCAAVRRSFGTFAGCTGDVCLNGLDGARVMDCGGGSRVGRGLIDLVGGGTITVVNVHGSSGITADDRGCREQQFEQVFVDLGDGSGQPAANGARNVVMGDLNTDPGRHTTFDSSARRFNDFVGPGLPFEFISDVGSNAAPTYANLFNIDHVVSDTFEGECWVPGVTPMQDEVTDIVIFDHKPIVCDIRER